MARQALLREANCEKPAKGPDAKDKGGARDAAIWLSVVDYLKSNPGETVYFVTGNTRDFGDGSEYPAPMSEDIKGLEERLQILTSFDSLVSAFSTPVDINEEDTERDLAGLVTSDPALSLLTGAVRDMPTGRPALREGNAVQSFPGHAPVDGYPQVNWTTWACDPKAVLRRVSDVTGHKIGEDTWYTAAADWILAGLAPTRPLQSYPMELELPLTHPAGLTWVACQWRTKLLFSNKPGEPPALLQSWSPQSLDPAQRDEWQPLAEKAMSQLDIHGIESDISLRLGWM